MVLASFQVFARVVAENPFILESDSALVVIGCLCFMLDTIIILNG